MGYGRKERPGDDVPAHLLKQYDQVQETGFGTFVLCGQNETLPSQLRHVPPNLRIIAFLFPKYRPYLGFGIFPGQKISGSGSKHDLLFRETKVHYLLPSSLV